MNLADLLNYVYSIDMQMYYPVRQKTYQQWVILRLIIDDLHRR